MSSIRIVAKPRRFILEKTIGKIFAAAMVVTGAHGATVNWDIGPGGIPPVAGNGTIEGGTGIWDVLNAHWTGDGGANNLLWDNNGLDTAVFGGTAGTVTLGTPILANGLTFDTAGYVITGDTLTLAGTTPTITANANAIIASNLAGTAGLVKTGTGTLTYTGASTYTGLTSILNGTLQLGDVGGTGTLAPTGVANTYAISAGATLRINRNNMTGGTTAAATAAALAWSRFSGAGNVVLASEQAINGTANWGALTIPAAFTGNLVVEKGRVEVSGNANLGGTAQIDIRNGAQLLAFAGTYTKPISIAGAGWGEAGFGGALRIAGAATGTWSGPITLTANAGILSQDGATFNLTGAISGAYQVDFMTNNAATINVTPAVQNTSASTRISGLGTVTLGNAMALSAGPLEMNGGILRLNGFSYAFPRLSGSGGIIVDNSAISVTLTFGSDDTSTTYGGRFANSATATAGLLSLTKLGAGTMTNTGGVSTHTGPTLVLGGSLAFGDGTPNRDAVFTSSSIATDTTVAYHLFGPAVYSGTMSGAGGLSKSGNGVLTLGGVNTFTGNTSITGGVLLALSPASLPGYDTAGKVSVGSGAAIGVRLGASNWTQADFTTLLSNVSFSPNSSIGLDTTVASATFAGFANPAFGLAKLGSNTLTVNTAQTSTAPTGVYGGTLALDYSSLATPANLLNPASPLLLGGGRLEIIGKPGAAPTSQTFASLSLVNGGLSSIALTDNGAGVALTITASTPMAGRTTGSALHFTIPSGGSVAWDAPLSNGMIGPWATVNAAGTVRYATTEGGLITGFVGTTAATAAAVNDTTGTANYELATAGAVTANSVINTLRYTGPAGTVSGIFSSNGIMSAGTGLLTMSSAHTIGASRELLITGSSNITMSGVISNNAAGPSGVTYAGTGVLTLGTANSYSGPLTVNSGAVAVATLNANPAANQFMGNGGRLILNGGALNYTGTLSATFAPAITVGPNGGTIDLQRNFVFFDGTLNGSGNLTILNSLNTANAWLLYRGNSPTFGGNITIGNGVGTQSGLQVRTTAVNALGTGTITVNTGGILTADPEGAGSVATIGNPIVLNGGVLGAQTNSIIHNGSIRVDANSTIATPQAGAISGTITINGTISGSASLNKDTGNTVILNGANTHTGTFTGTLGTVRLGHSLALQKSTYASGGANLVFDSTVASHAFTFGNLAGSGGVSLVDDIGNPVALTVGGNDLGLSTYSGALSGSGSLTKAGTGTLMLSGANSFTGPTVVSGGKLLVSGSYAGGAITAASGGTFGGSGLVSGAVTVNAGGGLEAGTGPGTSLLLDALTFEGAATLGFNSLGASPTLLIGGSNAFNANGGVGSVQIKITGTTPGLGLYPLLDYEGTLGGGLSAFTLMSPNRTVANLQLGADGSSIDLNITATDTIRWSGAVSSEWSASAVQNWALNSNGSATNFQEADNVSFTDAATNTTVSISGSNVNPSQVRFNSSKDYLLNGTAGIAGSTGLIKDGSGKLTISNTNSFTGAVVINQGVVSVASLPNALTNSPLGAGASLTVGGAVTVGTLQYTGLTATTNRITALGEAGGVVEVATVGANLTLSNAIGGGALIKTGPGNLTFGNAANVFSGPVTVNSGSVFGNTLAASGFASSFGSGTELILDGGSLVYTGAVAGSEALPIDRAIRLNPAGGTLDIAGTGAVYYSGTLLGSGPLTVSSSSATGAKIFYLLGDSPDYSGNITLNTPVQIRRSLVQPFGNATGDTTVNATSSITVDLATTSVVTDENFKFNGGSLLIVNGSFTQTGTVAIQTAATIGHQSVQTGTLNLNGLITGTGSLTISGHTGFPEVLSTGSVKIGGSVPSTFTGDVFLVKDRLELGNTGGVALASTNYVIGSATLASRGLLFLTQPDQIVDSAVITFTNIGGDYGFLNLNGNSDTIGGLVGTTIRSIVEASEVTPGLTATLTLAGPGLYEYAGEVRNATTIGGAELSIVKAGTGTQVFSGGTRLTYTGTTTVNGGTLRFVGPFSTTTAMTVNAPGILEFARSTADWTVSSTLAGNGNVNFATSGGIVTYSGSSPAFVGAATLPNGTLALTGSLGGTLTVSDTATLKGSGVLGGLLTMDSGATLQPGETFAAGSLTAGSVLLKDGTSLIFDLLGTDTSANGFTNDLVTVNGNLTLDGTLNVNDLGFSSFFDAPIGSKWTLFTYAGTLTNNVLDLGIMPGLTAGHEFKIDTATNGQVSLAIVPEPTAAVSLLGGLGIILSMRRRRS